MGKELWDTSDINMAKPPFFFFLVMSLSFLLCSMELTILCQRAIISVTGTNIYKLHTVVWNITGAE